MRYFFALLICFQVAHALANEIPYAGVWKGTIGSQQVQVCFSPAWSHYYYLRNKTAILLSPAEGVSTFSDWLESTAMPPRSKETGRWKLGETAAGMLKGSWSDPTGHRTLDITLTKVAELDTIGCGRAFFGPIEDSADPQRFRSFELPAAYKGASRFNSYVRSWRRQQAVNAYECRLNGGSSDYEAELTRETLKNRILTVQEMVFDVYCGGAHNQSSSEYRTYSSTTGRHIDTWSWIKGGESNVKRKGFDAKVSKLRKKIEALNTSVNPPIAGFETCDSNFEVQPPYPTDRGLIFPTSFGWARRTCDSGMLISYDELGPQLTPIGKTLAREFSQR